MTLKTPVIRNGPVDIPDGIYQPQELGVFASEIELITIGRYCDICQSAKSFWNPAHAHIWTPKIKLEPTIHFNKGYYVFEEKGVLSDTFIHEYCHILRGWNKKWKSVAEAAEKAHDAEWRKLMVRFGLVPTHQLTLLR
jgi:hypothetical protein